MIRFSVVIITLNEEENIGKCLDSVKDLTDDILVIDSGSTDATGEICQKFGARFIFRAFDDYSNQKNFGNSLARYDFILSLDADEYLSDELRNSIRVFEHNVENLALSFNRLNFHCGIAIRYGGWYPDKKFRFWNRKFARWEGSIHEWVKFSSEPIKIHLLGDIIHNTYRTKQEHINQAKKFAYLNAESDYKLGRKSYFLKPLIAFFSRFFSTFYFKLGILDGSIGYFIAKTTALASYYRYKHLRNLNLNKKC